MEILRQKSPIIRVVDKKQQNKNDSKPPQKRGAATITFLRGHWQVGRFYFSIVVQWWQVVKAGKIGISTRCYCHFYCHFGLQCRLFVCCWRNGVANLMLQNVPESRNRRKNHRKNRPNHEIWTTLFVKCEQYRCSYLQVCVQTPNASPAQRVAFGEEERRNEWEMTFGKKVVADNMQSATTCQTKTV